MLPLLKNKRFMKINFSPPYIDQSVIDEVVDTLKSGWITTGPKVNALESEIKNLTAAKEVLCVNSWTSGAIMMLKWLGLNQDDEVIIPAYTYAATALAVIHAGAKPVMVDVKDDFNIDVDCIRRAITPKTKAVIAVDIAGFPCDYDRIMELVQEPEIIQQFNPSSDIQRRIGRILIINDAAHSLGAVFNEQIRTGSETDISIFSLHAVKNITTAEGGAICLNLPESSFDNVALKAELKIMTLNCQTKDAFSKMKAGNWKYDIVGPGMKINMPDVNAAIGLAQIRQIHTLIARRKRVFEKYNKAFSRHDWAVLPPMTSGGKETSYHLYPIRIKGATENQRNEIIRKMAEKGVSVNVHFIPLPMLTYFESLGFDIADYPVAYQNYVSEISLPVYAQLTDDEVDFVTDSFIHSYNEVMG